VEQRGRLEGVSLPLAPELPVREGMQLIIHEGHEALERGVLPASPGIQQAADLSGFVGRHRVGRWSEGPVVEAKLLRSCIDDQRALTVSA